MPASRDGHSKSREVTQLELENARLKAMILVLTENLSEALALCGDGNRKKEQEWPAGQ